MQVGSQGRGGPCLAYKVPEVKDSKTDKQRPPQKANPQEIPSSRKNLFRSEKKGCNPDASYGKPQVCHAEEVKLGQQTREIQVSHFHTQALGLGDWLRQGLTSADWRSSHPKSTSPELRNTSQNVPEKLWSCHLCIQAGEQGIAVKDWLARHSRKSLRQFLSSASKAPTLPPPCLPGSVSYLLLTKNKLILASAVFSTLRKGRDYVWTEALGKVSECVTTKTTFGGRRRIWFVTHLRSGRRKAYGGLGLSLSRSTKCGGGRQKEGLLTLWLSET